MKDEEKAGEHKYCFEHETVIVERPEQTSLRFRDTPWYMDCGNLVYDQAWAEYTIYLRSIRNKENVPDKLRDSNARLFCKECKSMQSYVAGEGKLLLKCGHWRTLAG